MEPSAVCSSCGKAILAGDSIIYIAVERLLLPLTCHESRKETEHSGPSEATRAGPGGIPLAEIAAERPHDVDVGQDADHLIALHDG